MSIRGAVLWMHRWAGLAAAIPLAIAGITGAVIAFHEEVDALLNPAMLRVVAPEQGAKRLPLDQIVAAGLKASEPGARALAVAHPAREDLALGVMMGNGQAIYVDPYRGKVQGMRRRGDGFVGQMQVLHTSLMMGRSGKWIVAIATGAGLLMGVTGLWLWWPVKIWWVKRGVPWVRFHFDLHAAAGIYFLALTTVMTWTGLHMFFSDPIDDWMIAALGGEEAEMLPPDKPIQAARDGAGSGPLGWEEAAQLARLALPEARIRFVQRMARDGAVQYRVQLKERWDGTPGGRSAVMIDGTSGRVRAVQDSRLAVGGAWVNQYKDAIHTGAIGGPGLVGAYMIGSTAVAVQSVTGALLWWLRRKRK